MKLIEKIAKIQQEIGVMQKDTKGYNYKYFDINQLLEKLEPICKKHKVLLTQPIRGNDLVTEIHDLDSEEVFSGSMSLPEGVKPQDMGSAITYYRRYSIVSLFGIQAEDDDAKIANGSKKESAGKQAYNTADDLPM